MSRLLLYAGTILMVTACGDGFVEDSGSDVDPTTEFEITPPDVDTGWPDYNGARRRSAQTGWRRVPSAGIRD